MKDAQAVEKELWSRSEGGGLERREFCDGIKMSDSCLEELRKTVKFRTTDETEQTRVVEGKSFFKESAGSIL